MTKKYIAVALLALVTAAGFANTADAAPRHRRHHHMKHHAMRHHHHHRHMHNVR